MKYFPIYALFLTAISCSILNKKENQTKKAPKDQTSMNVGSDEQYEKTGQAMEVESKYEGSYVIDDVAMEEIPVQEMLIEHNDIGANNPVPSNISNHYEYTRKELVNNYQYFYHQSGGRDNYYETNKGICTKNGNVILPNCFSFDTYEFKKLGGKILLHGLDKYGVFDLNQQKWTIPLIYNSLSITESNLVVAKSDSYFGVLDMNNKLIVPFEYRDIDQVYGTSNLFFVSNDQSQRGIYDVIRGKLTVPCMYSELSALSSGSGFWGKNGTNSYLINFDNTPLLGTNYQEILFANTNVVLAKKGDSWGMVDVNDKIIAPFEYNSLQFISSSREYILAKNKKNLFGVINTKGEVAIPFEYNDMTSLSYTSQFLTKQNAKCGLVTFKNDKPNVIATCEYDSLGVSTFNSLFFTKKNSKIGLMNYEGKVLIPNEYESIKILVDNASTEKYSFLVERNNKFNLLNSAGTPVFKQDQTSIEVINKFKGENDYEYRTQVNFIKVKEKNGKYGIYDKTGEKIVKEDFDAVAGYTGFYFIVSKDKKYGIYELLTKKLILEYQYDNINYYQGNFIGYLNNMISTLIYNGETMKVTPFVK